MAWNKLLALYYIDIIAYLGKDRQDAVKANLVSEAAYSNTSIGTINAEIINNLTVNIIENSYGKPYIKMDEKHFAGLKLAKEENYKLIYYGDPNRNIMDTTIKPMMTDMYDKLLGDLIAKNITSPIFSHHIDYINSSYYRHKEPYGNDEPNQIVVDYIASMTDDYFVDLYAYLFPNSQRKIEYKSYFC